MDKKQLDIAEDEFCRLAQLCKDKNNIIHAHNPHMVQALAALIANIASNRLHPIRCLVETHDESGGMPVTAFTIEFANYGEPQQWGVTA